MRNHPIPTVRLRQKHQITVPSEAVQALQLHENDELDVRVAGDSIIITPKNLAQRKQAAVNEVLQFQGVGKGLYRSDEEAVQDIRNMRNEWPH